MRKIFKIALIAGVVVIGMSASMSPRNKYFEILKNLEIFSNLYKEINTYYVDDVDPGQLMRTGIDAMMGSLDPFTNYISENEIERYRFMTEGRYNGIGAISEQIDGFVTITELYEGQAADQAGLRPGDKILAVDGKDAVGKTPEEINSVLRGFPGTEVALTISRPGQDSEFDVSLLRTEVQVPNVPYSGMISEGIGYIALTTFTREAGKNVGEALQQLKAENPNLKGLVFDLRGNGGGLLSEAVNVSNVFIPRGELVVTTKGKVREWDRSFNTMGAPIDEEIPLVVLINKNSASASEIVSGVMQDYDRGVLIGQRSYGKGLVQNTREIGYNSKVKLTTAKYYIPSGRCIQSVEYEDGEPVDIADDKRTPFKTRNGRRVLDGGGVKPDIVIDLFTDEAIVNSLLEQHLIFDFVTDYCLGLDSIGAVEGYQFEEFGRFVSFLEEQAFEYDTESEKLLKKFQDAAAREGYELGDHLAELQAEINKSQQSILERNRETIEDLIEKEIASRFYYQRGKIQMGLRNDQEIAEAIALLGDTSRYRSVLAGQ
ncbi:S41 family peptidase [Phaeodactylibacter luteus]|uniref:PDZ domain-containing protein n=1 Tax=Phaeodactylibacter luteus TaxID=1564516 RepID=A0A5C6RZE1_9BACT|nr:S41 family peptidase [Phaeodactylibacter luteus]TXB67966.1 PDZ domain-containing protein [Phaeodactylibacter luteus]